MQVWAGKYGPACRSPHIAPPGPGCSFQGEPGGKGEFRYIKSSSTLHAFKQKILTNTVTLKSNSISVTNKPTQPL